MIIQYNITDLKNLALTFFALSLKIVLTTMKALYDRDKAYKRVVFARFYFFILLKKFNMKEAFYFPHDNNAHNDPKLMSLFMEHGLAGIGLYWIIIEIMHQQDNGIISEKQFRDFLQWYSIKQEDNSTFVEQVLNTFKTLEIFCFNDGDVYSKRVLQNKDFRKELSEKRSLAGRKSAEKRALNKQSSTSVEQNGTHVEQGKERKGKEKENKVNIYREFKHLKLTQKEFNNINKKYTKEKIDATLDDIENYKKNTSYTSLNLTLQKWLRLESERKNENKKEFEKKGETNWNEGL